MRVSLVLLPGALILLAACSRPAAVVAQVETAEQVVEVQEAVAQEVTPPVTEAQQAIAETTATAVVAVQEAVQSLIPEGAQQAPAVQVIDPRAIDLIIRWEVTSESRYTRALQWPIWPGGASGVTWGIGYDGGHQTRQTITRDWSAHNGVERLAASSGVVGAQAAPLARSLRDVLTPYAYGKQVFTESTLPVYMAGARRAYGKEGFDRLPLAAQGALGSIQYNRGGSMAGDRNREKRTIRDDCVPRTDVGCIAREIRSMCRLWRNTPNGKGLCARRDDEAGLAVLP